MEILEQVLPSGVSVPITNRELVSTFVCKFDAFNHIDTECTFVVRLIAVECILLSVEPSSTQLLSVSS